MSGLPHLALVAPTASGKTELALRAAEMFEDIEIVSVDSMQVYRGMDIGTAKVDAATRARIPHHLIDVIDPWEAWSVQRFQAEARAAVAAIEARGHRALLVGGTGLYVQAVIDDLRFPGEDLDLRASIEAQTREPGGVARAYADLEARDPLAASRIDPLNIRRIVRALEVIERTGERFSSFGPGLDRYGPTAFPVRIAGLFLTREVANTHIARRCVAMRAAGFVEEVETLLAAPEGWSRTARQAIGYHEIAEALDEPAARREAALDVAFETAIRRTRSFARRQRMWFRRDPRITWFAAAAEINDVAPALLAWWGAP